MYTKILTSVLGGVVVAVLVFAVLFMDHSWVVAAMHQHKLLPQPERFTELYLEDHLNLPKTYSRGRDATFKFTVHNVEHEQVTYEYLVSATSTESARIIDRGSFTLAHDAYKTIGQKIASTEAQQRTKINISLENKDQSIHFWVDKAPEAPPDQQ